MSVNKVNGIKPLNAVVEGGVNFIGDYLGIDRNKAASNPNNSETEVIWVDSRNQQLDVYFANGR